MSSATQIELRKQCKAAGIKNASQLSIAAMRDALAAAAKPAPAAKPAKAKATKGAREGGVKDWLNKQELPLAVADALQWAAANGRSSVTVYRQARELGLTARTNKGFFVKEETK